MNAARRRSFAIFGLPTVLLTCAVMSRPGAAAPPAKPGIPGVGLFDPLNWFGRAQSAGKIARPPEIVQMLSAIARGSQMGPGDGWFHPGQSRYGWSWLAKRYDANNDGRITRKEFTGPADLFARLDRDGDGVITREDFDWSERSPFVRLTATAREWMYRIDTNSNGRISQAEWDALFKKAAQGKDYLTADDLRDTLLRRPPPPPTDPKRPPPSGPSPITLAAGLFHGELGSYFEGPNVNDRAPNFTLKTPDGKKEYTLSELRRDKPVVLIFGSFT